MKIIILGAGQVGGTLAENLVGENNDITVVDINGERLRSLQDKFDLRVVQGHGSHPRVLREAGADDADMLVAVTSSDETNMVACQVAYSLFNTPNRIARIRSPDYVRDADKLFHSEAVPIDHLIAPEQLVIDNIYRLIEYPGALQVVNFAEGKVSLAVVKAYYGGPLIGNALSTMREHMPHIDTRVAAIFRHDRPIRPQGSTIVEAGDEVFFIAASQHIRAVMSELQRLEKPYKRIMLVGGGNIGAGLARRLEKDYSGQTDRARSTAGLRTCRKTAKYDRLFLAMRRIRNCWLKSILIRLICLLQSPTMMKPTLCRQCWPNGWVRRK
ncbi:potassium transporter peripheral membrane component [Citrobacter koseri]|nr:potassium transporter peripheral membrane component [Citrobacter koseri]